MMGKGCCGEKDKCPVCGCNPCRCNEKTEKGSCSEKCDCKKDECKCGSEKKSNW